MARLVDELLAAARLETPDFRPASRPVDLADLVRRSDAVARDRHDAHRFLLDVPDAPGVSCRPTAGESG
jgi:K+-sensing histidine kinase KdpD